MTQEPAVTKIATRTTGRAAVPSIRVGLCDTFYLTLIKTGGAPGNGERTACPRGTGSVLPPAKAGKGGLWPD